MEQIYKSSIANDKILFSKFKTKKSLERLLARQLYSLLAGHVLNVEFYHAHCLVSLGEFFCEGFVVVGIIAVAKTADSLHLLFVVVDDVYASEADNGTEVGRVFLRLHVVLVDNRERSLVALADGVNLVPFQSRVEEQLPVVIDIAYGQGIRIATIAKKGERACRCLL